MKYIVCFFLVMITFSAAAQQIAFDKPVEVKLSGIQDGYYPKLDVSGQNFVFTSVNYKGLTLYSFSNRQVKHISDEDGAGFKPVFSLDGATVYFSTDKMINKRKHTSLSSYRLSDGQIQPITSYSRVAAQPVVSGNNLHYLSDGKFNRKQITTLKSVASPNVYVFIENRNLVVYRGDQRAQLNPVGVESYIWPSVSPDGTKLLFYAIGRGTFVCNVDGTQCVSLGEIEAPVWLGNNYVIGMDTKDDGHQITGSELVINSVKGNSRQTITEPSLMAMHPSVSLKGNVLVFNTIDGKLYQMNFKIVE
jgi:Tol biopolymer transport system component